MHSCTSLASWTVPLGAQKGRDGLAAVTISSHLCIIKLAPLVYNMLQQLLVVGVNQTTCEMKNYGKAILQLPQARRCQPLVEQI